MGMSLPRGLGPVRLLIIFVVLISLLLFRSYYLPDPESKSGISLNSASFQSGSSLGDSPDVGDVDLVDSYYEVEETPRLSMPSIDLTAPSSDPMPESINDSTATKDTLPDALSSVQQNPKPATEPQPISIPGSRADSQKGSNLNSGPTVPFTPPASPLHAFEADVPACRQLPGADKVVVIVKTGATEAFVRVPEQLVTLAECAPNFMIFSDMEQKIGEFHVQDALDEIGKEYKEGHEDFQFYNAIHAAHASHADVSVLGSDKAWALDKWKNIPMLHKAYTNYPDAEWFVTIDADTYLSWVNLLLLLDRLEPDSPVYAGCVYWHGPTQFAQGGTGYLLSRKAVQKFEEIRTPEKIADWEKETSTICCGDVMLGVAMGHAGINVQGAWPMFQVDPPSGYSWGDGSWCSPAITWHHVHSYEVEALWQFEQEWINKTWDPEDPGAVPYLFRDVFEEFVIPHISEKKSDWNNGAYSKTITEPKTDHIKEDADWDWQNDEVKQKMWDDASEAEKASVDSADKCREVCEANKDCMIWSWHPGTCKHDTAIKMGVPVDSKLEYTSGWMIERIKAWRDARATCGEISFHIG